METTLHFLIVLLYLLTYHVQSLSSNCSPFLIVWFKVIWSKLESRQLIFEEQVNTHLWIQTDRLLRTYLIRWTHQLKVWEQLLLRLCLTIFHWQIFQQVETTLRSWVINLKSCLLELGWTLLEAQLTTLHWLLLLSVEIPLRLFLEKLMRFELELEMFMDLDLSLTQFWLKLTKRLKQSLEFQLKSLTQALRFHGIIPLMMEMIL